MINPLQRVVDQCWQRGQTKAASIDWTVFFTRLQQAIAWCHDRVQMDSLATCLRSPSIEPSHFCDYSRDDEACVVTFARYLQLGRPSEFADRMPDLRGGRLLAYFPDADLSDGAAEQASGGFFDGANLPPWDTWISYFEDPVDLCYGNYLVCYVPRLAIPAAQIGITVNPEECIAWLADTDTVPCQRLKSLGTIESPW
jgi:hypothetical protein